MTKEVFVSHELTGAVRASYSGSGGNFMAEPGGEIPTGGASSPNGGEAPKTPQISVSAENTDKNPDIFADSDPRNHHTRHTLDLISELEGVPEETRKAAQDKLAEDIGLDLEESGKKIEEIREELPAKGRSEARAQLDDENPAPMSGEPESDGSPIKPGEAPVEDISKIIPGYVEKTHRPKDTLRPEDTVEHLVGINKVRAEGGAGVPPGGRPPERPPAGGPEPPEPGEPDEEEEILKKLTEGLGRGEIPDKPEVDASRFTDRELKKIAEDIGDTKEIRLIIDRHILDEYLEIIRQKADADPSIKNEADLLSAKIKEIKVWIKLFGNRKKEDLQSSFRYQGLNPEDFGLLEDDPWDWLNSQIDRIYLFATEGQEASSPQISDVNNRQSVAARYLEQIGEHPAVIEEFTRKFQARIQSTFVRMAIQRRNMESVGGIAESLGAHGLLGTLSHEDGLVGKAHNRIQNLYDDVRVRSERHHIKPEDHSKIQQQVIDEYLDLVEKDPSLVESLLKIRTDRPMSEARKRYLIEKKIIRSVRAGYDHFVASQREAVIVARGEALLLEGNLEGILADPSALFMMFNYEQLLIAKFGIINKTTENFLRALKRKHAESVLMQNGVDPRTWSEERLIKYGTELQRDLMHVNDFYSSPWRIEKFLEQTKRVLRYNSAKEIYATSEETKGDYDRLTQIINNPKISAKKRFAAQEELSRRIGETMRGLTPDQIRTSDARAEDFSLFMRLRFIHKHSSWEGKREQGKRDVWAKVARYKPEDIVRLFREKSLDELSELDQAFEKLGIKERDGMTRYDVFKEEYGGILSLVRETGLSKNLPEQIDFSKILTDEYKEYKDILIRALAGSGGDIAAASEKVVKLKELFEKMQGFGKSKIDRLVTDTRFEYIYQRTYSVDDALIDRLETVDTDAGLTPVSKILSPEAGGDAYKRTMNDAVNANEAQKQYLIFLSHEDMEAKAESAKKAAEAAALYNTPDLRASVFYYTFGSYLQMGAITLSGSKLGTFYEVFDIQKLPFRKSINELQKVYGPHAPAFNIDQMVEYMDKYKDDLIGSHGDGRKLYDEMRRLVRIIPGSRTKFMAYRGLMFAVMYLLLEAAYSTYKTTREGLAADELKAA